MIKEKKHILKEKSTKKYFSQQKKTTIKKHKNAFVF